MCSDLALGINCLEAELILSNYRAGLFIQGDLVLVLVLFQGDLVLVLVQGDLVLVLVLVQGDLVLVLVQGDLVL